MYGLKSLNLSVFIETPPLMAGLLEIQTNKGL
jgi:hypothetical protein